MAVSADAVLWAYRLFLAREPDSENISVEKSNFSDESELAFHFLFVNKEFAQSERRKLLFSRRRTIESAVRGSRWRLPLFQRDYERVTRDTVTWGYKLLLGREPESVQVIRQKLKERDTIDLLRVFLDSDEFRERSSNWGDEFARDYDSGGPPLPPLRLRRTVGPVEKQFWGNPTGALVFAGEVPDHAYGAVFDFGCGCGRNARQMMLQKQPPSTYVGVDLNRQSIEWCRDNLTAMWPACEFHHLNVRNATFNAKATEERMRFPVERKYSLVNAHSVFTHIVERNLDHYFSECVRVLDADGAFRSTWFLFDKTVFPMMQEFQNCLYINAEDPTNAAVYDYRFVARKFEDHGLVISKIVPPTVRGLQWVLIGEHRRGAASSVAFPSDLAEIGMVRPPL